MSGRNKIAVKSKRSKKIVVRGSAPNIVVRDSVMFNSFCVNFPKFDTRALTNKDLCQGLYKGDL